jgi:hypothetical protein
LCQKHHFKPQKRCHRESLWIRFDEDAFKPLALLNTPKLNLNQRKIYAKQTFKRLGQSDVVKVLRLAEILRFLEGITELIASIFSGSFLYKLCTNALPNYIEEHGRRKLKFKLN